jgi:pimeloyl-ACP methyl ester carboxylesterase
MRVRSRRKDVRYAVEDAKAGGDGRQMAAPGRSAGRSALPSVTSAVRGHLRWERATVCGRVADFGVAGSGPALVFLHGWGLGYRSYKRSLKRLVESGLTVYAPALPGFGATAELPRAQQTMAGYAAWVAEFCATVGVTGRAALVGHSFGGGVAIETAYEFPDLVRSLVLVNSIGGSAWTEDGSVVHAMAERPLWDWGLHFPADILPVAQLRKVVPVILEDVVGNLMRNPRALLRVAGVARRADLTQQLAELRRRRLPLVVLWGEADRILPRPAFESLCAAAGVGGLDPRRVTVRGSHNWLLADPQGFAEIMTNVDAVAAEARYLDQRAS